MDNDLIIDHVESRRLEIIQSFLGNFHLIRLPAADLSTLDLDSATQLFLLENSIHDFRSQEKGRDNSVIHTSRIYALPTSSELIELELYVRSTGDRARRMILHGISEFCDSGDLLLMAKPSSGEGLTFLNVTALPDVAINKICENLSENPINKPSQEPRWPEADATRDQSFDSHRSEFNSLAETDKPKHLVFEDGAATPSIKEIFEAIWARGFGGSLAAESPKSQALPKGLSGLPSPGLRQAADLFARTVEENSEQSSLFLVGGPGAGKSSFAKSILEDLGIDIQNQPNSNLRGFTVDAKGLIFVNDASIRKDSSDLALVKDVIDSDNHSYHLLACVNRGVIADELNHLQGGQDEFSRKTLEWLSNGNRDSSASYFETIVDTEYLQIVRYKSKTGSWRTMAAVFLDVCSMLEPFPNVSSDGENWLNVKAEALYESRRRVTALRLQPEMTSFGKLLSDVAKKIQPGEAMSELGISSTHPTAANIQNLQNSQFLSGILYSLRVAEFSLGSILTFRGFWSIVSKLIFGQGQNLQDFSAFVREVREVEDSLSSGLTESTYTRVMQLRSIHSLYPFFGEKGMESAFSGDPGIDYFKATDPIMEADMDRKLGISQNELNFDLSSLVMAAVKSIDLDASPMKNLQLEESEPVWKEIFTPFEELLDQYVSASISSSGLSESKRRQIILRYSIYLARITGLFFGNIAGKREAEVLMALWKASPAIPTEESIKSRFSAVIRPKLNGDTDKPSLMPLLDGQIQPIVEPRLGARLAITLDDVALSTKIIGPNLFLVLKEREQEVGVIELDFPLIKEVLASTGESQGVTELSFFVQPRLERVRASKLRRSENLASFVLVNGDDTKDVVFREEVLNAKSEG